MFIVISDLVPGKQYCVGVAARTSAGVGNYTQLLIPCKCIHFCNAIFITSMKAIKYVYLTTFIIDIIRSVHKPSVPSPFLRYSQLP